MFTLGATRALWAVLILALVLRLPGIPYGLPLHLYGDEEVNVYSALKMLELHTVLPVLHKDAFVPLLYEPPVTVILFALAFIPTLAIQYVFAALPALSAFKYALILDPSVLWYVARFMSVIVSVMNVALVYAIGKRLFKSERAGLYAALFLAFSFIDVSLAPTARHWEFGILSSLVAVWLALGAFDVAPPRRWRRLAVAGAALGTAVGTIYVALLAPLAGLLVLQESGWRFWQKSTALQLAAFLLPCFGVAAVWVLVHPFPLFTQTAAASTLAEGNTLFDFIRYYVTVLFQFDTPLLLASVAGFVLLLWTRPYRWVAVSSGLLMACACMYVLMPNFVRYAISVVPLLALCAGYAVDTLLLRISWQYAERMVLVLGVLYVLVLFGRYEQLLIRNDTRVHARTWIMESMPSSASVLIDSNVIKVPGTLSAIKSVERIAPEVIRAGDRALLSGATVPAQFNAYPLFVQPSARSLLVKEALERKAETYLVVDAWSSPPTGYGVVLTKTPVLEFLGQPLSPSYLVQGGEPIITPLPTHLIQFLYSIRSFGPDVTIYTVKPQ